MIIDFSDYDCFIAECYEAEDEFWKDVWEDLEADYWINEGGKKIFEILTLINKFNC